MSVHRAMLSMISKLILNPAGVCDPNSTTCLESNAWVDCSVDPKYDDGMNDKNFRQIWVETTDN